MPAFIPVAKLDQADRLYLVVSKFCEIDLHPNVVSNLEMGYIFEELIRRFNEASNEEAGDHFTPREVIRLMVNLIFTPDSDVLTTKGIVKTLYDPACGTGGMLSVALSIGSPLLDVIQHSALRSSDFPPAKNAGDHLVCWKRLACRL